MSSSSPRLGQIVKGEGARNVFDVHQLQQLLAGAFFAVLPDPEQEVGAAGLVFAVEVVQHLLADRSADRVQGLQRNPHRALRLILFRKDDRGGGGEIFEIFGGELTPDAQAVERDLAGSGGPEKRLVEQRNHHLFELFRRGARGDPRDDRREELDLAGGGVRFQVFKEAAEMGGLFIGEPGRAGFFAGQQQIHLL